VYYTQTLAAPSSLWRLSTAGGEPEKVLDGVIWRSFAVLQKGIYYVDDVSGVTRLRFFDLTTRLSTTIGTGLGTVRYGLTATNDGRTILFTRVDSTTNDLMLVENFR
jgi:hypothetical protein